MKEEEEDDDDKTHQPYNLNSLLWHHLLGVSELASGWP
jgi:hypothetical protein